MKVNFSYYLVHALIVTLIISGIMPAIVAADGEVPPGDDGNLTGLLPDLVIENLSWSPVDPEAGEQVTITATVKNQGDAASGSTNLTFYSNGSKIGEGPLHEIGAQGSETVSISWKSETESTVEISAKVDEANLVEEKNEDNNVITAGFISFKKKNLPDLIIDTLDYTDNPELGEHHRIRINVKNEGTAVSEATTLALYIDGASVKEWDVSRLSSGESSSASYTWIPTLNKSEETEVVEIRAVVDENNLVVESNEGNNEKKVTETIAREYLPDLIIQDIIPESAEGEAGKILNLTLKVKNQGTVSSAESQAKYYINGTAPTQNDIQIPAISEGGEVDVPFSLIPDREGQIEVKVHIDSGTVVYESNEDNNEFTKIIDVKTILPDLIVESLSLNPEAPKIGDNIAFTVSIKNKGLGDSASSELKYYINGTNTTHNGKIPVPAIAAGETTAGIFYWVPEEEGNLNLRLVADDGAAIQEKDETNNELAKIVSISRQTTSTSGVGSGSGSGSSSSSSSSMGSGVSKEPAKNIEVKELDTRNIMSGYHVKYDFAKNATCVTYIEFDPIKNFKKTTATVEVLKGKSIFVQKNPPGRVYKQLNIWVGNKGAGLPDSLTNGYVGFKVEKDWIKNNIVDESNVTLLWYDSKWEQCSTEKTGEDKDYVYFRAKISGYSCFAISEYTGEEGTMEESADGEGVQETLRSWGEGNMILNSSAEKEGGMEKKPMGVAKILLAVSLPLFMVLMEYFVLKKKI